MENEKKFFIVQYPLWELDIGILSDIYDNFNEILKKMNSDYGLVFMPNIFQLHTVTKEQLKDIRDFITDLLEKNNDSNSETGTGSEDCG